MIRVSVKGTGNVVRSLTSAASTLNTEAERAMRTMSFMLSARLHDRFNGPKGASGFWGPTSPSGAFLGARSGQTRARLSPGGIVLRDGLRLTSAVGSPDPYVKLHEEGGTVTGNQFLRIPTANALTAGGVDKNAGRSVRGLPGYRVIRTSAGRLWIVRDAGGEKSGRIEFMYLLVRSITLRARHIFAETARELEPIFVQKFREAVGITVQRANA